MPNQQTIFPVVSHFAHTPESKWRAGDISVVTQSASEEIDITTVSKVTPVQHTAGQLEFLATDVSGNTVWVVPPTAKTKIEFKKAAGENAVRMPIYLTTRIPAETSTFTDTPPDPNLVVDIQVDKQFLQAAKQAGLISVSEAPNTAGNTSKTGIVSKLLGRLPRLRR